MSGELSQTGPERVIDEVMRSVQSGAGGDFSRDEGTGE